jgi:ribosome-binding protein aMBF1 (putative translation factor)
MNNQLNAQGGPPTIQQYPMNNQLNAQGGPSVIPTNQQYPMNNQLNAQGGPSVIPTNQQYPMNNQLNAQGGPSVIPLQSMDQQYSMNNQSQSSMANPLYELNASPSIIPQSLNQQYKPTNNSRFPSNEKYNMSHMRQVTDYGNEDVTFDKIPLNKETFDNNLPRVSIDNSIILHNATNGYFESEITTANPDESDSFKHGHLFSHNAPPKKEFKNPVMFNTVQQQPNEIHVTYAREPPPNNRPFNMGNAANGMTLIGEVVTSASNNISGLPYDELMSKSSELGYMRDSAHQPNVDDATSHSLAFDELSEHLQIKNFQSKPDTTLDNMPHMKKNKAVTFDDRSIEDSISSITEQNQEEIQAVVNYSNGPDLPNNGQLVREPSDKLENIEQHENLNENKSKNNNKVLKADIVQSNNTGKRLSQKELPQQVARKEAQILGQSTGYLTATESPVTNLQSNEEIKLSKDTDGSEYEKYVRLAETTVLKKINSSSYK